MAQMNMIQALNSAMDVMMERDNKVVVLPCGHYTLGEAPYKFMDGYHIISFFVKKL